VNNVSEKGSRRYEARRCGVNARGVSMLELAVVLAIVLILAAFALPQLMRTISMSRVRGAAIDVSGLVQQARIMAEKQNTTLGVYTGTVMGKDPGAFINCSPTSCAAGGNGSSWQAGDPTVAFTNTVTNAAPASAPSAVSPGHGFITEPAGTILFFNARGLPVLNTGAPCTGIVFYFTDSYNNWAALSVSESGRSKVWVWSANSWN
jgi:prepilin-type N-terminal cleavage/methylation domain-containing protein